MGRKKTGNKDWTLVVRLSKKQQAAVDALVEKIDQATYTSLVKSGFRALCEQNQIKWPKDNE